MGWADSATGGGYGGGPGRDSAGGGYGGGFGASVDTGGVRGGGYSVGFGGAVDTNGAGTGHGASAAGGGGWRGPGSGGNQQAPRPLTPEEQRAKDYLARIEGSELGLIDPSQAFQGDQGASELLGQLNRAQWADWKERFAPYIRKLADKATDTGAANRAAGQAKDAMGLAFDAGQRSLNQQRESFGVSLTPRQQEAQERRAGVQRAAAMASAGNQARISALDRQSAILAGGMGLSNIPDKVFES
ncbi:hypothetical protein HPA02_08460 [Bisbaumannia pacifica]|uniref:Uncharacterized protein n=1 Tax=Bisbaumannia pacifica TaxID=77098 RepID=A0A510X566_9GAMM|nr:hypothetical protein [Halomonas pacifica]GEK46563.1 hypothetical protein HPA02_08460 [Halomonas pacifica]